MVYAFKTGSRPPSQADAQATGTFLAKLARKGNLKVEVLTDLAEANRQHPILSPWFTWDSSLAVRKYHEIEAGEMIRSVIRVEVDPVTTGEIPTRAFVSIGVGAEQRYEAIEVVIRRPDEKRELIDQIEREYAAIANKQRELLAIIKLL
jgi:hypothetical protein